MRTYARSEGLISVGLLGCNGRMGKRVAALMGSEFSMRAKLLALVGRNHSTESLMACDVVIDFSSPDAVVNLASKITALQKGPALIVASTGWQEFQRKTLDEASQYAPMIVSANFSLGVLAFMQILRHAGPLLDSLGYKPVLIETHHVHKKDAPSGTALALAKVAQVPMEMHSIRAGEVVGDHQVSFYGPSDVLRLEHSARDRDIFARGAIEAALWLAARRIKDPSFRGLVPVESFFSDLKRS